MSLPVTRQGTVLASQAPDGFSRAEGKELVCLQNRELTHGLVRATRVLAAGMVAPVGLQTTAMLSREAATANRLNFIVDQFATFVGGEIARFGHRTSWT
jgi:hypothetical protein